MRNSDWKHCSTCAYSVPSTRSSSASVTWRHGQLAAQEHRVLDADREVGADERVVAAQQVLVQLGDVLLRRRHHVRLVAQRALAERQPHRGELLVLAAHAHVPPHAAVVRAVDRDDVVGFGGQLGEPPVDPTVEVGELLGVVGVGHRQVTSSRTVRSAYSRRSRAAAKLHV